MTYKEFIQNIIDTRGQWSIPEGEYFEVHHILPRCMGGEGKIKKRKLIQDHENLICLYAREHFIAHRLLAIENPDNDKLVFAWSMMAFPKGKTKRDYELTPEEYEEIRCAQSKLMTGKRLSEETKNKLSSIFKGRALTEETRRKISEGNKGKILSEETKRKMSDAQKRRDRSKYKAPNSNKIVINNGVNLRFIDKNSDIPEGWVVGNCRTSGKHDMTKYRERIKNGEKSPYSKPGSLNPNYGNGKKVSGGRNGHAIYIYTFEDIDYQCRDDLMLALKERWSDISESTIRRIMKGKYTNIITKKYQYVIDNLTWRLKSEDKVSEDKQTECSEEIL